jgi:hypothetical protein
MLEKEQTSDSGFNVQFAIQGEEAKRILALFSFGRAGASVANSIIVVPALHTFPGKHPFGRDVLAEDAVICHDIIQHPMAPCAIG